MTASPAPEPAPRRFSLHRRVTEVYHSGEAVSPSQITDSVMRGLLTQDEILGALEAALPAYVSRFVSQQRTAGLAPLAMRAVRSDPAEGTNATRRRPDGVELANPIVSGGKKSGYDALVDALSVRVHGGPRVWVTLADATPAHLRFAADASARAAEGHAKAADRYRRWAKMVTDAEVKTFGDLAEDILAGELLAGG